MKEFIQALAGFSASQLLLSLAALTPFVAGIWVAMKWAYDTRLKNLETMLADFRADFERRLARETAKLSDVHEKQVSALTSDLKRLEERAVSAECQLQSFKDDEEHRNQQSVKRRDQVAKAEKEFVDVLDECFGSNPLGPKTLTYLCENPTLIGRITFAQAQIDDIKTRSDSGESSASYVLGRVLLTGRMLREGILQPDKDRGLRLIQAAAELGHLPSRSFSL